MTQKTNQLADKAIGSKKGIELIQFYNDNLFNPKNYEQMFKDFSDELGVQVNVEIQD